MYKTLLRLIVLFCSGLFCDALLAQTVAQTPDVLRPTHEEVAFRPTHEEMVVRYRRQARIDSITRNVVFKTTVHAHWLPGGRHFWYCNVLKDSVKEFVYVDALKGTKVTKSAGPGPIGLESGLASAFSSGGLHTWNRNQNFQTGLVSPDKQWEAFIKEGNVFVRPIGQEKSMQFTTDGTTELPYGRLAWAPDSKYLVGYHIHPVKDSAVYYILTSIPGTTRGQLRSHPYKQPGDPFTTDTMFLFTLAQSPGQSLAQSPGQSLAQSPGQSPGQWSAVKVNTGVIDFMGTPELHWITGNPSLFTYEKVDRGHQRFRVIEVNAATAQTHTILDEKTTTFIYESRLFTSYPPGANLLFYTSEKDGWRHIYRVDLLTGREQQVTKGNWVVREIDSLDMVKREIWFRASGRNADEDPYLLHYYRIGMDGQHLQDLTPETGNHSIVFSPDKTYFIDTYSQVNVPPVIKLRRSEDGKEIILLETADLSLYNRTGVHPPVVFTAKGRDGLTDIWGIADFPSDFDPAKKYPVLENIYAGPQDAFVPKSFTPYSEMQSMAELGFIVVMIDGMGTANRSKAFHDVCWKNLADAGLPDRILWIKALAGKYPSVDLDRVGLYGTSAGGQNTVTALLFHPEFYKAGVASCGCQDNRVDKQWWNEQWMGYPVGPHYAEQSNVINAYKLQGSLMLIVGEADNNVPPESTYRVADALIKAGKNFDFLPMPGMDHTDGGPYGRLRKRDFFVLHLLGVRPPDRNSGELIAGSNTGRERWDFGND
jgi:dienelactone hydrolase